MVFFRLLICFFFFQAEDGIRDIGVTGVQTCALPICRRFQIFSQQRKLRAVPSQLLNMFQRQEGKYYIQGIAFDLELGKFKRQRKWQLVIGLNRSEYPE